MAPSQGPTAQTGASKGEKRKADNPQVRPSKGDGDRAAKRVKVRDARTIAVQPAVSGLNADGELDVHAFLEAKAFEVAALEAGMEASRVLRSTRAFQSVPRSMRRRTASHDPRRVPRKLRARARKELEQDNTPARARGSRWAFRSTRSSLRAAAARRLGIWWRRKMKLQAKKQAAKAAKAAATGEPGDAGVPGPVTRAEGVIVSRKPRPKIRRNLLNDPPILGSRFRKRQIGKTWLPTHLWHAKRARMTQPTEPLWGFAMALTPTEKCYRPTHRASGLRGAVAWDTSYMSTIGLYGSDAGIEETLRSVGLTRNGLWNSNGARWRNGTRHWSGMVSRRTPDGGRRDMGLATVIWNPVAVDQSGTESSGGKAQRQVFLRVHPSAFREIFSELVRIVRGLHPQPYVEDLRFQIGSIEITGPASTEALLGVLHPYHTKDSQLVDDHAALLHQLNGLTNPAALPPGVLLSFDARDPRLQHPPTTVPTPSRDDEDAVLHQLLSQWPVDVASTTVQTRPSGLFDREARHAASAGLPSQSKINRRRAAAAQREPGVALDVTPGDPPIPVILLATRPASSAPSSAAMDHQRTAACAAQGTWTVLLPWGAVLPVWHALMHYPIAGGGSGGYGNPRFGGLDEQRQVTFERGEAWFPGDFPETDAGVAWELAGRRQRKADWAARPSGRRVNWESVVLGVGADGKKRMGEVGVGWACDWEMLFGLKAAGDREAGAGDGDDAAGAENLKKIRHVSGQAFMQMLRSLPRAPEPPPNSLVRIRLTFVGRGIATSCARIYRLPAPLKAAKTATKSKLEAVEKTVLPSAPSGSRVVAVPHAQPPSPLPTVAMDNSDRRSANIPTAESADLRARWLATLPDRETAALKIQRSLAGEGAKGEAAEHPPVPGEEDLIGFVTTDGGGFSLAQGRGAAVGCVAASRLLEGVRREREWERGGGDGDKGPSAARLCIVRNVGVTVGWLARWDALD